MRFSDQSQSVAMQSSPCLATKKKRSMTLLIPFCHIVQKVKNYAMIATIALNCPCTGRLTYSIVSKKCAITVL